MMMMMMMMMMKIQLLLFLLCGFSCCFAFSSHFNPDGDPLTELSWSSSLTLVSVSFSGLFTVVFVMLACLCCKRNRISFKEFKNVDSEDVSTVASPASDVYVLPLTEVSLPVAKQPVQLLKTSDLGRHSLFYLKELGHGWFGKVLLAEINPSLTSSSSQVVVKELQSGASVHEQIHFLEETRPFRVLQHPALLHCLFQCTDVSPFLLVMEFCPLGDVKGHLQSCRRAEAVTPEPLVLQQMACDIAAGLLHLHKNGFVHSDLALRNCLLTSDLSVKIGDYGLSHTKYQEDYYLASDQSFVPLRWIAPELAQEVNGKLIVAEQNEHSNIWSLGVTIWELFEFGNQPYRSYSDRQVLSFALREQQLRLKKPLLRVPLAERWYEVMQFCWLQPDQRPNAEEVHLLLSYLCAKGASEAEEDFERRWNSLRPNIGFNSHHIASALSQKHSSSSSFPLLEQFSATDGYHSESGDDILTITETSHGLNFEYKWELARAQQSCTSPESSSNLGHIDHCCQEPFYPPGGVVGSCPMENLSHGLSPYYQSKHLHTPAVLPVLSAHSPSVSNEYYIRIEEPVSCTMDPDYTMCSYSPDYQGSNGSFMTGSADSGECMSFPSQTTNMGSYWSAEIHKSDIYDSSDSSPAMSLTMEPLLGQVAHNSPLRAWESSHYVSYKDKDGGYYYEHSPPLALNPYVIGGEQSSDHLSESWGSRNLRQALGELEHPLGLTPSADSPSEQTYIDPYLDTNQTSAIGKTLTGGYYDMMGSLRKTMPSHTRYNSHSVSINMETKGALFIGHRDSDSEEEEDPDVFVERHSCNTWPSKHRHSRRTGHSCRQDAYVDFHFTMPSTDIEDSWPEDHSLVFHSLPRPIRYPEPHQAKDDSASPSLSKHNASLPSDTYVYLCHDGHTPAPPSGQCCHSHFVDPLAGLLVRTSGYVHSKHVKEKTDDVSSNEEMINLSPAPGGPLVSKPRPPLVSQIAVMKSEDFGQEYIDLTSDDSSHPEKEEVIKENLIMQKPSEPKIEMEALTMTKITPSLADNVHVMVALADPQSEASHTLDSGLDRDSSSAGLVDILDCSDDDEDDDITDDITDITSGIFVDESSELHASPAFQSLQKQVETPDSMDSIDLPPGPVSCDGFSPASSHPSSSPKAMDSGYDTENNQSPEFVPKESRDENLGKSTTEAALEEQVKEEQERKAEVELEKEEHQELEKEQEAEEPLDMCGDKAKVQTTEDAPSLEKDPLLETSQTGDHIFSPLSDETPYRDSAYFSDYENERQSRDEGEEDSEEREGEQKHKKKAQNEDEEEAGDPAVNRKKKDGSTDTVVCDDDEEDEEETELPLDEWPSQDEDTMSLGDWAAEVVVAMEEALGALNVSSSCTLKEDEEDDEGEEEEDLTTDDRKSSESGRTSETTMQPPTKTIHSRAETLHTLPKDEVALQHSANSRRFSSSSTPPSTPPPFLSATDGRGSPAEREEPKEEGGDTDDSDESDEEQYITSYGAQEEESEDECHPVPIVVSDDSHAHNLRSVLKAIDNQEEAPQGRKTVSFFDDVTVYLFDQESPTKDLTEINFPNEPEAQRSLSDSAEKVNVSDDSSDGNLSEESTGYEWEDDFRLLPLPTSSETSETPPTHVILNPAPESSGAKQNVKSSRFTVSRFSITHVTDSDVDSTGGSGEDMDKDEDKDQ